MEQYERSSWQAKTKTGLAEHHRERMGLSGDNMYWCSAIDAMKDTHVKTKLPSHCQPDNNLRAPSFRGKTLDSHTRFLISEYPTLATLVVYQHHRTPRPKARWPPSDPAAAVVRSESEAAQLQDGDTLPPRSPPSRY